MSKQVILTEEEIIAAYKGANGEFKEGLKFLYKDKVNFEKSWKDIKTFEDACEVTGQNPNSSYFQQGEKDDIAYKMLKTTLKAINGNWTPDWTNSRQPKYYIWWEFSGGGFRLYGVDYYFSCSGVGSRLSFESAEKARHAAEYFTALFNQYLN